MLLLQVSTSLTYFLSEQEQQKSTGILTIRSSFQSVWKLYLCTGRIIWASSDGSLRRLRRLLWRFAPNLEIERLFDRNIGRSSHLWDYEAIRFFFKRGKLQFEDVQHIVETTIVEVFFEILQQDRLGSIVYEFTPQDALNILKLQLTIVPIKPLLHRASSEFQTWKDFNLGSVFPDRVPHIVNAIKLKESVSLLNYKKLIKFANGDYTLREISFLLRRSDFYVSQSLLPYINRGWIELIKVPDISKSELGQFIHSPNPSLPFSKSVGLKSKRVVVCVDVSVSNCKLLKCIFESCQCHVISIPESTQAILKIMEIGPGLIFLEAMMPIANGYEICAQLRRIDRFKNIPIVMMTSQASLVQRLRAKFAGASHFLRKPICSRQVLSIISKYCDRPQIA